MLKLNLQLRNSLESITMYVMKEKLALIRLLEEMME